MNPSNEQIQSHPEAELQVIRKIMEDSRKVIIDNGWHYILWGAVVTVALVANYIMALARVNANYYGMMWFVLMIGTWIAESVIERRIRKKERQKTFAGSLLSTLWSTAGVCMFIFGFVGSVSGAYNPIFICPIISTVLGVTYIISGAIQQIKWMQLLSIGWWSGAMYMFLFPSVHTLIIFAVMVLCLQVTPGVILYLKWRKNPQAAEII
jgi:hypothetical protein